MSNMLPKDVKRRYDGIGFCCVFTMIGIMFLFFSSLRFLIIPFIILAFILIFTGSKTK